MEREELRETWNMRLYVAGQTPRSIVAIPTLVRKTPPPIRRIIGDLAASEKVAANLDLTTM